MATSAYTSIHSLSSSVNSRMICAKPDSNLPLAVRAGLEAGTRAAGMAVEGRTSFLGEVGREVGGVVKGGVAWRTKGST